MDGAGAGVVAVSNSIEAGVVEMKSLDCNNISSTQSMNVCGRSKRGRASHATNLSLNMSEMTCVTVTLDLF